MAIIRSVWHATRAPWTCLMSLSLEGVIRALLQARFFDLDAAIQPRKREPAQDLRQAVAEQQQKNELCLKLPGKNCGACGAPDCDALAADVVSGQAELGHCPFVRIEQLLHQPKTSDP